MISPIKARAFWFGLLLTFLTVGAPTAQPATQSAADRSRRAAPTEEQIKIPPVYCETCIREKRIQMEKHPIRLLERDGREVIDFIKKRDVHYLESDHIKFVSQIPSVNLAVEMMPKCEEEKRNWKFLKQEIDDLKPLFPRIRVGTLNSHQMAHLMMNRLIRFYATFEKEMDFWKAVEGITLSEYGMGPHLGMVNPFEVYVLRSKHDYLAWEDKFIGRKSIVGQKWHLFADHALVFTSYYHGNFKLFNNFVQHNVAHLFLWGYRGWTFKLPGWIHIGYAHFVERNITPKYNTVCYDEGGEPPTVKGWRWGIKVRKAVVANSYTTLADLKDRVEMAEFTGNDHLICWSIVRYLIEFDKVKWRNFVDLVNRHERMSQEEALRKSYGWSFNILGERWREHVIETYPRP